MNIVFMVTIVTVLLNTTAFGMSPGFYYQLYDDKARGKERVLVFTEEEVAQNEMKDVIKLTVSVRGDDKTSTIRAEYTIPKGQMFYQPKQNAAQDRDEFFRSWGDLTHSGFYGPMRLDYRRHEYGSLSGKRLPTFACDAPYVATGYLYLRTDFENLETDWYDLLQKNVDRKTMEKFKKFLTKLTEQMWKKRKEAAEEKAKKLREEKAWKEFCSLPSC